MAAALCLDLSEGFSDDPGTIGSIVLPVQLG